MGHANSFKELDVYKLARELAQQVFKITKEFPKEEKYSLTDQVRRSSRSIGAQIAEAWAKRRYKNHFISKLTDSDGEQLETQHWIESAFDCEYLTREVADEILSNYEILGRKLNSMIDKAHLFCSRK